MKAMIVPTIGRRLALALMVYPLTGCEEAPPPIESPHLILGAEIVSVGVLDGPADHTIGQVTDIVPGPAGGFYVLDRLGARLRHYSPSGDLIAAVGHEGDGPGEFSWPWGLALTSDGDVLVLSLAHRYLARFRPEEGGLRFVSSPPLPFAVRAFCLIGDRIFGLNLNEEKIVHEISLDGEVLRSFGDPIPFPTAEGPLEGMPFDMYSAEGHILCDAESGSVVVLPHILPHLRRFSLDGELIWETELTPYSQTQISGDMTGFRMGLDPETGTTNVGVSISKAAPGTLLLQLAQESDSLSMDHSPIDSRMVDLESGVVVRLQDSLPRIRAISNGIAYTWEALPFPRVRLFPVELRGAVSAAASGGD